MFRFARSAVQGFKTPLMHRPVLYSRHVAPAINLTLKSPFSQTTFRCADKSTDQEEDLETIDPKDFPELYPEGEELDENDEQVDKDWFVDPEYADEKQLSETDFIPLWQRRALGDHLEDRLALQQVSKDLMESGKLTAETLSTLLVDSKMDDVQVIDVREKCDWADYMIVASSTKGDKYLSGVAEHVGIVVKKAINANPKNMKAQPIPHIEGRNDKSGWLLIDLGRIIVHLFTPEMRERYNLEGLWKSVPTDPSQPMIYDEEEENK